MATCYLRDLEMRAKEVWTADGGNNPSWGYRVPFVSKIRIESSASMHSSELLVECGRSGGGLIVWQSIMVRDPDTLALLFFGRIDDIRPISSGTHGKMWRIHARDFMSTLTDNLVCHTLFYPGPGPAPPWFVPNWRIGCGEGGIAGTSNCGKSRLSVVQNLAMAVRQGFVNTTSGAGFWMSGDIITPNYLESSGMTIYTAVQELAAGHPYVAGQPGRGVGYDFRQLFNCQPPVFQYFKKGTIIWNGNKVFIWEPPDGSPTWIPIVSYDAEREGFDVYSRVIAAGHGDLYPSERQYIDGVGWREWGGTASPGSADQVSAGMTSVWNPPEWGGKQYRIQREAYVHDESAQDEQSLAAICLGKLRIEDASGGVSLKGVVASTFVVAGIPVNAQNSPPLPGDAIKVKLPDLTYQNYIVDKWVYEEPPGLSYFTIGRRPMSDLTYQMLTDRKARQHSVAAAKRGWTSPWWATQAGKNHYWIDHNLGVVPRNVSITFAKYSGPNQPYGSPLPSNLILQKTIASAVPMYADPDRGAWAGFQVIENTKDRIELVFADWVGYSRLAASSNLNPDGWCALGKNVAFGVSLVA